MSAFKSTKYQVSVSNTVPEATRFRSIPTSIHKYQLLVSCHVPRCPIPSQHISHRMRPNESPQNTFFHQHPSSEMMSATIPSPTVDASSERATKQDNAHQHHARSVQTLSCPESGFFSQAQSVSVHGLQPLRVRTPEISFVSSVQSLLQHPLRLPNDNPMFFSVSNRRVAGAKLNQRI